MPLSLIIATGSITSTTINTVVIICYLLSYLCSSQINKSK